MLEHVVVLSEGHLVRLARSYIDYYHDDRCHLGLDKDSPNERPVTPRRHRPQKSLRFREWAGCTIATNGAMQRRAVVDGQRARDRSS